MLQSNRPCVRSHGRLSSRHLHQTVIDPDTQPPRRISRRGRAGLVLAAVALAGMLAVAGCLTPADAGLGTHQQLGFPPCSFRVLFDCPCPTCGMTTSWACLVRGQLACACRANCGGTLLAVLAVLGSPWLLLSGVRGRWLGFRPQGDVAAWTLAGIAAITLVQWIVRLAGG